MSTVKNRFLVGLAVLSLSLSFVIAGRGNASAVPRPDEVVVINSGKEPVPVIGTVRVARPELRRGHATLVVNESGQVAIPDDVVLTDLVVARYDPITPSTEPCHIGLVEPDGVNLFDLVSLRIDPDEQSAELHLESGIAHAPGHSPRQIYTMHCNVSLFWSGYTDD